jgi:TIR domain
MAGDRIFISYRRSDTAGHTGRLYDRLSQHFGPDRLFMDIATLEAGVDFANRIGEALDESAVVLAVIGDQWESPASDGTRRIDHPMDFVHQELAGALVRGLPIIPVLVEGRTMPAPTTLPPPIQGVSRYQALELTDVRWPQDVSALIARLEGILRYRPRVRRLALIGGLGVLAVAVLAVGIALATGGDTPTPTVTGSGTGLPTIATSQPGPTGPSPSPTGSPAAGPDFSDVVFSEAFNDNAAGWLTGDYQSCVLTVGDGRYAVRVVPQQWNCYADVPAPSAVTSAAAVAVEETVTLVDGPAGGGGPTSAVSVGLECRRQGGSPVSQTAYFAQYVFDGRWQLLRIERGASVQLDTGTTASAAAPVGQPATLRLECYDGPGGWVNLVFSANGQELFRYEDTSPLPPGRVAIHVGKYGGTPPGDVDVDDVAVYLPAQ